MGFVASPNIHTKQLGLRPMFHHFRHSPIFSWFIPLYPGEYPMNTTIFSGETHMFLGEIAADPRLTEIASATKSLLPGVGPRPTPDSERVVIYGVGPWCCVDSLVIYVDLMVVYRNLMIIRWI